MKENKSIKYLLYLILFFIIILLIFYFIEEKESVLKDEVKNISSIPTSSSIPTPTTKIFEEVKTEKHKKKKVNMLNLYESRKYGYPNLREAYVFCYINSALQLIRSLFSGINYKIPKEIVDFIQYNKAQGRVLEIEKILKLIVPIEEDRKNLFYYTNKINNELQFTQSDSYEFLEKMLNYCISKNKELLSFISFTSKSIEDNTNVFKDNIILTIGNLKILYKESLFENKINFNTILNDAILQPYFSTDLFLDDFSDYLIVHLDLMDEKYKKMLININIDDKVQFKTIFDNNKVYRYNVLSVVCHIGKNFNSGHYVNYSRRPLNKERTDYGWFLYDDIKVSEISDLNESIKTNQYQPYIILLKMVV